MSEDKALVVREETAPSLLEGSPSQRVQQASEIAQALSSVVEQQNLYANISNRRHVLYEGWTTLGALVGVFPVTVWTREIEDGWEARVEARTLGGAIVGAAEAQCTKREKNWSDRDSFAIRSMAQTRAGSKALRMPLGFIMALAGYDATPAEEMDVSHHPKPAAQPKPAARPPVRSKGQNAFWAVVKGEMGASEQEVKETLGLDSIARAVDERVEAGEDRDKVWDSLLKDFLAKRAEVPFE